MLNYELLNELRKGAENKKRVAAYCRVYTDKEDQANSFESQQRYFKAYIEREPDWDLKEIYADEGITGTNTKKRKAFHRMIEACKNGEIDLIVKNGRFLVFVEVKLRKNADFAKAREYVNWRKQDRIRMTASIYLSQHPTELQPRFDVIEIYAPEGMKTVHPEICHMEDAFQ